ncbi:ATP-binding protein [Hungatella effluvii]|uniref:ATP-binding protein n=1 Tax=Hungatella effluvii TaxID=1096246 RepID=UPI002A8070AD|nr:ATP-binding protein [Hungatella effluvii]
MRKIKVCLDEVTCQIKLPRWIALDSFISEGQRVIFCGPSGSGKTVLATTLLGKLSLHLEKPLIYLVDPKGIDFRFCESCKNYYPVDNAVQGIEAFFRLFEARLRNQSPCTQPAILFTDEISSLILSLPKKEAEELKNKMARLLNLSRALNISIITAMQRPSAELFANGARDNYNIRFLMGNMANNKESVAMIANEYKDIIEPCPTGIGYLITDNGIKKIRSVMPRDTEKLHDVIREAVNREPQGGAEQ